MQSLDSVSGESDVCFVKYIRRVMQTRCTKRFVTWWVVLDKKHCEAILFRCAIETMAKHIIYNCIYPTTRGKVCDWCARCAVQALASLWCPDAAQILHNVTMVVVDCVFEGCCAIPATQRVRFEKATEEGGHTCSWPPSSRLSRRENEWFQGVRFQRSGSAPLNHWWQKIEKLNRAGTVRDLKHHALGSRTCDLSPPCLRRSRQENE